MCRETHTVCERECSSAAMTKLKQEKRRAELTASVNPKRDHSIALSEVRTFKAGLILEAAMRRLLTRCLSQSRAVKQRRDEQ